MKQCREHNCPLQDICRGAVDNETWWNIGENCEIFAFVNAQADKIFALENRLKECENGYEGTLHLERAKVKDLTEENERLKSRILAENHLRTQAEEMLAQGMSVVRADTLQKYKSAIIEYYSKPTYQPTKEHPIKHTQIEHLFAVLDQVAKEMLDE